MAFNQVPQSSTASLGASPVASPVASPFVLSSVPSIVNPLPYFSPLPGSGFVKLYSDNDVSIDDSPSWAPKATLHRDADSIFTTGVVNQKDNSSWISTLFYLYLLSIIRLGYQRPLRAADVPELSTKYTSASVLCRFSDCWRKELARVRALGWKPAYEIDSATSLPMSHQSNRNGTHKLNGNSNVNSNSNDTSNKTLSPSSKYMELNENSEADMAKSRHPVKKKNSPEPSIVRVLLRFWGRDFFQSALCFLIYAGVNICSPLLLRQVLQFLRDPTADNKDGILWMFVIFCVLCLGSMLKNHGQHSMVNCCIGGRAALIALLTEKVLRLSSKELLTLQTGEFVNLIGADTTKLVDNAPMLQNSWSSFLQLFFALIVLVVEVGVIPMMTCVALLFPMVIANVYILRFNAVIKLAQMKLADERVNLMNEMLLCIRAVKMYSWEDVWTKKILIIRKQELAKVFMAKFLRAINTVVLSVVPLISVGVLLVTYEALGNELSMAKSFTIIALFNVLRQPLRTAPMSLTLIVQLLISFRRIAKFLCREERVDTRQRLLAVPPSNICVFTDCVSWKWTVGEIKDDNEDKNQNKRKRGGGRRNRNNNDNNKKNEVSQVVKPLGSFTLSNVSLTVTLGQLVFIVGQVGCGKSALLSGILGDMPCVDPASIVCVNGRIAYCPQTPWIMNATIKENILFGTPYEEQRYNEVLSVCCLTDDLRVLRGGDEAEVGERGITLSGGQKARISLARAVYADADMYLLDDPLSAVDPHVAESIFRNCILGMLKGKAILLVTHQLQLLPFSDFIVAIGLEDSTSAQTDSNVVDKIEVVESDMSSRRRDKNKNTIRSCITEQGTYDNLMKIDGGVVRGLVGAMHIGKDEGARAVCVSSMSSSLDSERNSSDGVDDVPRPSVSGTATVTLSSTPPLEPVKSPEERKEMGTLTENEERSTGSVSYSVCRAYIMAAGGWWVVWLVLLVYTVEASMKSGSDYWAGAVWSGQLLEPPQPMTFYFGILVAFNVSYGIAVLVRAVVFDYKCNDCSGNLHVSALTNLLHASMTYFDTTPLGRILNRFSRDMEIIDQNLPQQIEMMLTNIFTLLVVVIVMIVVSPWLLLVICPVVIVFILLQRVFRRTSREVHRLENLSRSPMFSHCGEVVVGMHTLRSFRREETFQVVSGKYVDNSQRFFSLRDSLMRCLQLFLEFLAALFTFGAGVTLVFLRHHVGTGLACLALTYSLQVSLLLTITVRLTTDVEGRLSSVERLTYYADGKVEMEPPSFIENVDSILQKSRWPHKGKIEFRNVCMRYRAGFPLVLNDVSFMIPAGCHIGVVGRTGSGKSSLMVSLFRIVLLQSGSIFIDDVNIAEVGIRTLRQHLTIVPQDPVMTSGTIRSNLDPLEQCSDIDIWSALDMVGLKDFVSQNPLKLDRVVQNNGADFSVGQRQLICLARAVLRDSHILLLDEATSSIDGGSDNMVQSCIKHRFKDTTVITIAHRIHTVLDCDLILVMSDGRVSEFGSPRDLCNRPAGMFRALVERSGISTAAEDGDRDGASLLGPASHLDL